MTDSVMLLENIKNVYRKISSAAIRSGRSPFDVTLVAVTKTVPVSTVQEAIELGLRVFGESRVQEAREKIVRIRDQMPDYDVSWHLVGHLQKNKVKHAVELFDLIHSVDSAELAREIDARAGNLGKIQHILIQVKLSHEETKSGIHENQLIPLLEETRTLEHIRIEGLMTIPPFSADPEQAKPYFRRLRDLRDRAEQRGFRLPHLSMGMTHDFEVAILEGATMVRIGTAIFGERTP